MLWPCLIDRELGLAESEKSGWTTVTLAVPETEPLVALTAKGPPAVEPALNSPLLMVPPPLTDHVNVGWVARATPFWS